jgi:hypothetical protein
MTLSGGVFALVLAVIAAQGPRAAAKRKKAAPPSASSITEKRVAPAHTDAATSAKRGDAPTAAATGDDSGSNSGGAASATTTKTAKTKVYTFGAMDVEGKLKTPQLLYFLNRVKLELEMSAPDHRSFMKELERTVDDPSL